MPSSWIWRRVTLVRTDVSWERITSSNRVTRIGKLGTTLADTNNGSILRRNTYILLTYERIYCQEDFRD
jgi:hypothetical protein